VPVSWRELLELADAASEERGRAYVRENRVRITSLAENEVLAVVEGTDEYDVRLRHTTSSCACPVGRTGVFCKHCVAVALVASAAVDPAPVPAPAAPHVDETVARWLDTLDARALRALVAEAAETSVSFEQALTIRAAKASGDLGYLAALVDRTLRSRRRLGWRESNEYAHDAHRLIDEIAEVISPETADAAMPVVERAIRILYRVILHADDSSGSIGYAVRRLLEMHTRVARLGSPDPRKLARWLLKYGVDDAEFFVIDVDQYQEPLGETGLALYRREVDKRVATDPDDFYVRRAVERLAIVDGDVDRVIELVGGELNQPHHFLNVVEALQDMGEDGEALRMALAGVRAPVVPHQTARLYDAAAALLSSQGDNDRVIELRHEQMERLPSESSYGLLRQVAADTPMWTRERAWALDVLLKERPDAWLSVLLNEDEIDLAWDAAHGMDLDPRLFHRLLKERAKAHPEEVFHGFTALVNAELTRTGQQHYRVACGYLRELRKACERSGQLSGFQELIESLVVTHQRRPTLVTMLQRLEVR
jgi:uncharacterized Zn finger protein